MRPKRTLGSQQGRGDAWRHPAAHHHPGDQIAYIAEGVLTYTVEDGTAKVMKGPGDDGTLVRKLGQRRDRPSEARPVAGRGPGQVHHARNNGTVPVVIYLATLLRTGEPAAIPD